MVRSRDPFGETLDILRTQLRNGEQPPGAPLNVVYIAKALRISPTPVREALCRLSGEGLVEVQRGRGFCVRRLESTDVVDYYQLHLLHVTAGLSAAPCLAVAGGLSSAESRRPPKRNFEAHDRRDAIETLFAHLVRASENSALVRAHAAVADQLAVVRLVEAEVFSDLSEELSLLSSELQVGAGVKLHALVQAYHQRRILAARGLASAVREKFRQSIEKIQQK